MTNTDTADVASTRATRVVSRIGTSTDLPRRHWTYRRALERWVDAVLVNADSIRKDFVADLPSMDPARVITVYDGIEMEEPGIGQAAARMELGLPLGTAIVGTVTRLSDHRGSVSSRGSRRRGRARKTV